MLSRCSVKCLPFMAHRNSASSLDLVRSGTAYTLQKGLITYSIAGASWASWGYLYARRAGDR